jgi:C4-dicarboxylate-specific signal transduction histidine kinase
MVLSDLRLRRADASWLEVRSTVTVLDRLADGGVEVVGFMAEVTAERAAQAQAAAAGRLAALGEMGTGLAHELKQPLATISLAAENALRGFRRGNPEAVGPRLERIIDQAQRAAGIIENLRRFARGSEPGAPPVPVPLDRAVESALALVGGPLQEAGIEVALALEAPPPLALGQMVSLEQVLVNLLLNAADALRAGPAGAPRRIRIAAAAAGEMVRLTIADSGGGIHAAILPRLFEPFVATKDADQGTGLGLSICHGLVKAMGGSIEARNEAEGAVFSILLPRAVAAASLAG